MSLDQKERETYWAGQFSQGNTKALNFFFDLHYKSICYFSARLTQDDLRAEDIGSECFIKLWERFKDFHSAGGIKAFLYITCKNACLDYLKQLKRKNSAQQSYLNQLETEDEGILLEIIETDFLKLLSDEIEQLPEKCREIVKLIYYEGKKTNEIAVQLNLSVQTVRNQKIKGINALKNSILKKGLSDTTLLAFMVFLRILEK